MANCQPALLAGKLDRLRHPLGFTQRWVEEYMELRTDALFCFETDHEIKTRHPRKTILLNSLSELVLVDSLSFQAVFRDAQLRPVLWRAKSAIEVENWMTSINRQLAGGSEIPLVSQPSLPFPLIHVLDRLVTAWLLRNLNTWKFRVFSVLRHRAEVLRRFVLLRHSAVSAVVLHKLQALETHNEVSEFLEFVTKTSETTTAQFELKILTLGVKNLARWMERVSLVPALTRLRNFQSLVVKSAAMSAVLVCGPPAAGKTTFSLQLSQTLEIPVLSVDNLERQEGKFDFQQWKTVRQQATQFRVSQGLCESELYIVDDTFHLSSSRKRFRPLAAIVWLDLPLHVCLSRNLQRGTTVPPEILVKTFQEFEPIGKHAWERNFPVFRTPEIATISNFLKHWRPAQITNHSPTLLAPVRQESTGAIHYIDGVLRKIIGETIQSVKHAADRANLAEKLNERRKQILQDLRVKPLNGVGDEHLLKQHLLAFLDISEYPTFL